MTLRKKWTNTRLENKKCTKCKKTFPRTGEYFYSKKHPSQLGSVKYSSTCIACENKRCAEYKSKNREKQRLQDIKYKETERGYFKELWTGVKKSKHGNDFESEEEFLQCWENQKAIYGLNCPYFPWIQMTRIKGKGKNTDSNISKDRILSTMPYGPKNIMFCSWKANNMKGNVTPYVAARYLEFVEGNAYCKKVTEFELSCLNNLHNRRWGEDIDIIGSIIDNVKHDEELRNKYIDKLRELFYDDHMEH
tara:strand:- start:152 stop:898 length:747 start_codon:yes stop_codon:yes gene_type:complete